MKIARNQIFTMMWIVLFCFFTVLPCTAQEAYEELLGEWDVETEDGQYGFVFTFSIEDDELHGLFSSEVGEVVMEELTYEDSTVEFTVNIDMGGQMLPIDFSVTIDGDSLTGWLAMEFGEANITGKKRK